MTSTELAAIMTAIAPVFRDYVEKAIAPVIERNKALELHVLELQTRPEPPKPERGERGDPGQKGDTGVSIASTQINADGRLSVHLTDGRMLDAGPVPKPERGERGEAGKDATVDLKALATQAAALIPLPKDGLNGKDATVDTKAIVAGVLAALPAPAKGERGDVGPAGKDAPALDVDAVVQRVAALVPTPKDGAVGPPGPQGERGSVGPVGESGGVGPRGEKGLDGRDGLGIADLLIDRTGGLVATFTDGRTKTLGMVAGKDGEPGAAGRDAEDVDMSEVKALVLGELATWPRPKDGAPGADGRDGTLEGVTFDYDGERTLTVRRKDGSVVDGGVMTLPVLIDRGVFVHGKAYEPGDGLTHDGNYWINVDATTESPGEGSKAWRLAVRRGKQGREGKAGKDFTPRPNNTPPLYG